MLKPVASLLLLPFLPACIVPDGARPTTSYAVDVATHYMHRGMVQNERGVLQPELVVALPAKKDGTLIVRGFGNVDLSNDTGNAWLPDGHASRFSQLDWNFLYEQIVDSFVMTFGLVSYNLPNGLEFRFGERGATTEILAEVSTIVGPELRPTLALHYDIDEVEDFYVVAALERTFDLSESWSVDGGLSIGYMGDEQAFWNYAMDPAVSGLSDLRLTGDATYNIGPHTDAHVLVGYSTIIDSEYREWFADDIGIDDSHVWLALGIRWTY